MKTTLFFVAAAVGFALIAVNALVAHKPDIAQIALAFEVASAYGVWKASAKYR